MKIARVKTEIVKLPADEPLAGTPPANPNETRPIVVLDMAVLAESELGRSHPDYRYTFVVTVEAPSAMREERAVARGSDRADVRRRMRQQATDEQRRHLADVVIVNDGTTDQLETQVDALWERLRTLAGEARAERPPEDAERTARRPGRG